MPADAATATTAVSQLIEGLDPGAMVTQFVVIAEVIDTDGERGLWVDTHEGSSKWDTYGLLTWALNQEHAGQVASFGPDEDADD